MRAAEPLKLGIFSDYAEEGWPSMDLTAELLHDALARGAVPGLASHFVRPAFRARLSRVFGAGKWMWNGDRLLNRMWDYPRLVAARAPDLDLYHVADHSYAHLVHSLPPHRTGVYCHDIDLFRSLARPELRPAWFRRMARYVADGMAKASVVFHSTMAVRAEIVRDGLCDPARLVHAPYGIAPEFVPQSKISDRMPFVPVPPQTRFLLHVSSCIPRKRVDVLLDLFAELRRADPELRLVQIGGEWSAQQRAQIEWHRMGGAIQQHRGLSRAQIADLYQRAQLVLLPSEAEGFGLPVLEALACGTTVVASDLPVLREVGGEATIYLPAGDVASWAAAVARLLQAPASAPNAAARAAQAAKFSWTAHAKIIGEAYLRLL